MNEFLRKNFAILLAFFLPIAFIGAVALGSYLPSFFVSTEYNFLYTTCTANAHSYYGCKDFLRGRYSVVDNTLTVYNPPLNQESTEEDTTNNTFTGRIFLHNTKENISREIPLEEAKKLKLSALVTSPDGVSVSGNYNRSGADFFPFFSTRSDYSYYLQKGGGKQRLNLINNEDRYYYYNRDNFHFIGWILADTQ